MKKPDIVTLSCISIVVIDAVFSKCVYDLYKHSMYGFNYRNNKKTTKEGESEPNQQ